MRIALAQIDTTIGSFQANLGAVADAAKRAAAQGARLLVAPELTITGYPPRDFLEHVTFVRGAAAALDSFVASDLPRGLAIALGTVEAHEGDGTGLYNAAVVIDGGRIVARARKCLLPTYDVFDEGRYFDPSPGPTLFELDGVRLGLTICEDLWNDKAFWPHRRYTRDPVDELAAAGAQILVNLSASPYALGKPELRERMIAAAARRHGIPIAMTNLVGGDDALLFDGRSFVLDAGGTRIANAASFREELTVAEVSPRTGAPHVNPAESGHRSVGFRGPGEAGLIMTPLPEELSPGQLDELFDGLVLGTRDYARKTGFRSAVLGLSGGIDSALVAVVAVQAFGPERVTAVSMPSRFTATMSNDDAQLLSDRLGIRLLHLPIEQPFQAYLGLLADPFHGRDWDVTEENLQARVRGALLMALSNKGNHLLLTTGNKSELATGYCTLYGDMCGGLAVIGDVPKTIVYALSRHLNSRGGQEAIPRRIIDRPPSAELKPDQTDQDSLPPYDTLDRVLRRYIEARESADDIALHEPSVPRAVIDRVLQLVRRSEYKRRQAAPVLRVTPRAFGEGWRFPIAHGVR